MVSSISLAIADKKHIVHFSSWNKDTRIIKCKFLPTGVIWITHTWLSRPSFWISNDLYSFVCDETTHLFLTLEDGLIKSRLKLDMDEYNPQFSGKELELPGWTDTGLANS